MYQPVIACLARCAITGTESGAQRFARRARHAPQQRQAPHAGATRSARRPGTASHAGAARAAHRIGYSPAYFFFAAGLRLVMRPLSVPAFSSMTALTSVGRFERIASSIALRNSSGVVAWTPTPPNASISFS
jgi:hypothetical protein